MSAGVVAGVCAAALVAAAALPLGAAAPAPPDPVREPRASSQVIARLVGLGRGRGGVQAELVGLLARLGAGLRAGASVREALRESSVALTGPTRGELARLDAALQAGVDPAGAFAGLGRGEPTGALARLGAALAIGHLTGGAQAEVLDRMADALRDEIDAQAELAALSAQARLSAVVIAAAPAVFFVVAASADPTLAQAAFTTPLGAACVAAGLSLDAAAFLVMRRLTRWPS